MTSRRRIAFIGNSLPRRCGIATFTSDLQQALANSPAHPETSIVAMNDEGARYDYPPIVSLQVQEESDADYERAARHLNTEQFDVVCLQHEFGIFGSDAGRRIMKLLAPLRMPIVTTLHTILETPSPTQRRVLREIIDVSATVVVMAEKGRELLHAQYDIPAEKIVVIPHGIPDCAFVDPQAAKVRRGFDGRAVILTFGLLSPNKGIEVMLEAMPAILRSCPDAIYVVLGATHPNLVRREGEAYRQRLKSRAQELGIEESVVFLDQFVDQPTLVDFISMCDVYVTPYLNEAQMTSGTLAYSFGVGKAVVSTPYWHASELLAAGRGILVGFGDSAALGNEISELLTDHPRRQALREHAYAYSRAMTWERTAERYLSTFENAIAHKKRVVRRSAGTSAVNGRNPPALRLGHFLSMCDDTGIFQHALHSVPDRAHGYCVDDNARALLLACVLRDLGEEALPERLTVRLAAFVQHSWNPATRRFRNFMSFDRRWLEDIGSEDSHGRVLWALGECARSADSPSRKRWAAALFAEAAPAAESLRSPRAWAFSLLGLAAFRESHADQSWALELQRLLADRLLSILSHVETPQWAWFENGLAYENARLPQALLVTGASVGDDIYVTSGLRSLDWLMNLQTADSGIFRPVGSDTFGDERVLPRPFDQQPLEATAALSACLAAWRADGDPKWKGHAMRAFDWFFGGNDLSLPLIDPETGSCCDGLHPTRVNENQGGESVVSYLLGLAEMRQMARLENFNKPAALRIMRSASP